MIENTLILTNLGFKPVQDIQIQDIVYTSKNRFKTVSEKIVDPGHVYRINTQNNVVLETERLVRTAEKGFNGKGSSVKEYYWRTPDQLVATEYLVMPKLAENIMMDFIPELFANLNDGKVESEDRTLIFNLAANLNFNSFPVLPVFKGGKWGFHLKAKTKDGAILTTEDCYLSKIKSVERVDEQVVNYSLILENADVDEGLVANMFLVK